MTDIAGLKEDVTQLTAALAEFQPVLQASLDLTGVAVAKLDELFLLVQGMGSTPTPAQLDELAAAVTEAKDTLAGDITSLNLRNAAMQEELTKIANKPPTEG